MKRKEIVDSLLKEGLTEKTLAKFTDKQLSILSNRILGEGTVMIPKDSPSFSADLKKAQDEKKTIETYEEKGKLGSNRKKTNLVDSNDKQLSSEITYDDLVCLKKINNQINRQEVIQWFNDNDLEYYNMTDIQMYIKYIEKNMDGDNKLGSVKETKHSLNKKGNLKEWVKTIANKNFHSFTSKNEIVEMIKNKIDEQEFGSKVKKGHNNVPEFMTYDSITSSVKDSDTITKPAPTKPTTKPSIKPRTPYQPGPGKNPKPKALKEKEDNFKLKRKK
jgi:hypothetical protein